MTIERPLQESIERELAGVNVPGCSIAVVDDTGPVWAAGVGRADVRTGRPATERTVYHLFSGTKLFTAAAILKLVEYGRLALTDPLRRYLPEAQGAAAITIEQLLSHRSGLADTLRAFLAVSLAGEEPPASAVALSRYRIKATRRPGERVEYRNVNYALLGEVVTRASGIEYREFVAREVLKPLGMEASFSFTDTLRAEAATGYIQRTDPMRLVLRVLMAGVTKKLYGQRAGALIALNEFLLDTAAIGGLIGSVTEFAKFLHAQLAANPAVLSAALTRKMQTKVADGAAGIESRQGMALGWKVGSARGRPFLNHEGGGPGFTTELRLYPEERVGIALAMNAMRMPRTMRAAHRICETVLARGRSA